MTRRALAPFSPAHHSPLRCCRVLCLQVEEVRLLPVTDIEQEIKARREHERRTGELRLCAAPGPGLAWRDLADSGVRLGSCLRPASYSVLTHCAASRSALCRRRGVRQRQRRRRDGPRPAARLLRAAVNCQPAPAAHPWHPPASACEEKLPALVCYACPGQPLRLWRG